MISPIVAELYGPDYEEQKRLGRQLEQLFAATPDIVDIDSTVEAVELLRGEPGSQVQLSVFREGAEPFRVQLTREVIAVASVRSRMLADGIGYVRITQFQEDSGSQTA